MSMRAILRLFNGVLVPNLPIINNPIGIIGSVRLLGHGLLLSNKITSSYSDAGLAKLLPEIREYLGFDSQKANATFHKSWNKVKNADIRQLVLEQIAHYITTYGFETIGVYSEDSVYVPTEKLSIPQIDVDKFKFTIVHGYTQTELKEKLMKLLTSGIALHEDTIKDVVEVALMVNFTQEDLLQIKNKEVSVRLCKQLKLFPNHPIEFLRLLIFLATEKTLIIQNKETIEAIQAAKQDISGNITRTYEAYIKKNGYEGLASIFLRFKVLFLAFRHVNGTLKAYINTLRRQAVKYHKPMPKDLLNDITGKISKCESINQKDFETALAKANIFRKARVAQAIKLRKESPSSLMYRIRNGKAWTELTTGSYFDPDLAYTAFSTIFKSIDLSKQVRGKTIYIPKGINYSLPATEKQFTGNIPTGTSITCDKDMLFGIHWENYKGQRTDIDLSLINISGTKIGWDGYYRYSRNNSGPILFSGDMTDAPAPHGASEFFYINKYQEGQYAMFANHFNFSKGVALPLDIIIASDHLINGFTNKHYMVDPNKVIATAKTTLTRQQMLLGFVNITKDKATFYFAQSDIGKGRSVSINGTITNVLQYLQLYSQTQLSLSLVLLGSGAFVTNDPEKTADIDLSPENLQKDTIIKLLA